jgi:hypothetical protein
MGRTKAKRKSSDDEVPSKKGKTEDKSEKALKNPTESDHKATDYTASKKSEDGKEYNFKISSWNVGGIRSVIKVCE